ncbi:9820_t:CDS:2, partial [Funneliformis caledonium]
KCENVNKYSEHSEHSECYALFSAVIGKSISVTLVLYQASLWGFCRGKENIDENILESFIRNLRQEPKNEWIIHNINVTEIFCKYQQEVLKTLQSTGLTWDNT